MFELNLVVGLALGAVSRENRITSDRLLERNMVFFHESVVIYDKRYFIQSH